MTNEKKAREIIKCSDWCESINKCDYKNTSVNCYAYGIAMAMAEWKDEEFAEEKKQWIERQGVQSYWKPSEEQMQTLHAQLNEGSVTYPEDKRVLTTLYEDLMKIN